MFPEKSKWLERPIGWQDLGKVKSTYDHEKQSSITKSHSLCMTILRVGKEDEKLFLYCPMCLVKINL